MPWSKSLGAAQLVAEIGPADTGTTKNLGEVPAGHLVTDVTVVIETALSGGTPSLTIGDAGDADGWVESAAISEGVVGAYKGTTAGGASYVANGKYYPSKTVLTAAVSAGLTSGRALVLARVVNVLG